MWGYGNSAQLVQLHSYEEARNKYDMTKPIRGRVEDTRPLGRNRSYTDRTIKMNMRAEPDDFVGKWVRTYSANLWGTDYVEWFPDGKLALTTKGYSSPTIFSTINYLVADAYGELESVNGKWYFKAKDGKKYYCDGKTMMLEPTGEEFSQFGGYIAKVMKPVNPIQEHKYRANRKELNAIRKHYRKFIDYGKAMLSIDNTLPEKGTRYEWHYYRFLGNKWWRQEAIGNRDRVFKMVDNFLATDDLDQAYQAATELGHGFGYYSKKCEVSEWVRGFDEMIKYRHADKAFIKEPVEIGQAFYDRNAKYFD